MIASPHLYEKVKIWYRKKNRAMPYHGKIGYVLISGRGKPRNHLIKILNGPKVVVPCGNLQPVRTSLTNGIRIGPDKKCDSFMACPICDGSGQIPAPDGYAICKVCFHKKC